MDHFWPVSTTPLKDDLTGINDTGTAYITGVIQYLIGSVTDIDAAKSELSGVIDIAADVVIAGAIVICRCCYLRCHCYR